MRGEATGQFKFTQGVEKQDNFGGRIDFAFVLADQIKRFDAALVLGHGEQAVKFRVGGFFGRPALAKQRVGFAGVFFLERDFQGEAGSPWVQPLGGITENFSEFRGGVIGREAMMSALAQELAWAGSALS